MTWRLLVLLMGAAAVVPWLLEARTRRFEPMAPRNAFLAYYVVQLGLSGWLTLSTGVAVLGPDPVAGLGWYERALGVALLGLLAFQGAWYLQAPRGLRLPRALEAPWRLERVPLLAGFALLAGTAAFLALLQANGGLTAFLADREAWRAGGLTGQGILLFPATTLPAVAALAALLASWRTGRYRAAAWGLLALSLVPPLILGFRGLILAPLAQALVLRHTAHRPFRPRTLALALGLGVLVFTGYGILREMPEGERLGAGTAAKVMYYRPDLAYAAVARSRGTEVLAQELRALDAGEPHDLGWRAVLEALTLPVPKALWPGKPVPASERFATAFFGETLAARGGPRASYGGVSPTVAGELCWHFGLPGVLLGMAALGALYKVAQATFRTRGGPGAHLVQAALWPAQALAAESLQGAVGSLVLTGLLLAVLLPWLAREPGP